MKTPKSSADLAFYSFGGVGNTPEGITAYTLPDGRDVTFASDQCLVLKGHDGLERRYRMDFGSISWLDGTKSTAGSYKTIFRGCEGVPACEDIVKVSGNEIPDVGTLSLTGHTTNGDEVYEILPEGRELRTPLPYMHRVLPGDDWNTVDFPTQPTEFYGDHPLIFIKDEFERYHRYLLKKYWPWC